MLVTRQDDTQLIYLYMLSKKSKRTPPNTLCPADPVLWARSSLDKGPRRLCFGYRLPKVGHEFRHIPNPKALP